MKKIELLAPCKNLEYGITAINYGADAVYIGGKYSARKKVGNSLNDIEALVNFAHKYNCKVYVALNTILDDFEIEEAQKLIWQYYNIGVDAIIFQDMGLLECDLPNIDLHSSTQCDNSSLEKIKFLENCGVKRAILSRELSLEQIKLIGNNVKKIELETFIHGALCVSYSGNCYLSFAIGKRSANRGVCAQPCRKKYSLIDDKNNIIKEDQHLLCLKDLHIDKEDILNLINANICSFKIEGRLKDKNYIKNVVSYYRREIDSIISSTNRSSMGISQFDFIADVTKTFNRKYCKYFLNGKKEKIWNFKTPKHTGENIGKVIEVLKDYFIIDKFDCLNSNDGICFYYKGDLVGTKVIKILGNKIYPLKMFGISVGNTIYRNYDYNYIKKLEDSCVKRRILCNIKIYENGDNIAFEISDNYLNKYKLEIKNDYKIAKNKEKMILNFKTQMKKSFDTEFLIENVEVMLKNPPFLPFSKINEIRRELLEEFGKIRLKNYVFSRSEFKKTDHPYIKEVVDYCENIYNKKAQNFYKRHKASINDWAIEKSLNIKNKRILKSKHCILYALGKCKKKNKDNNKNYYLIDDQKTKYKLEFNCKNCEMYILG